MLTLTDIKQLVERINEPVLSLYLVVDPALQENQAATPAWRIWLKNSLRQLETNMSSDFKVLFMRIHAEVEVFLDTYVPSGKTLVLFYGRNIQQTYELPVTISNYASFGDPALSLLVRTIDQHRSFLLTLVTHNQARFFVITYDTIEYETELDLNIARQHWHEMTLMPATAAGGFIRAGSHRDRFAHRVDEQVERFYQHISEEAIKLADTYAVQEIVLGGDEEAAHAVREQLLHRTVIGPVAIAHYLSPTEIIRQVVPIVTEYRLMQDKALVEEIIQLARSGGRALLGTDVLKALKQRLVELLVLPLVLANEKLADELVLEGLLARTQVKFVDGVAAELLTGEYGCAARLYYRPTAL